MFKDKVSVMIKGLKELRAELRSSIDNKCVYEAGGNLISGAIGTRGISKSEIEELKEIAKQEAK